MAKRILSISILIALVLAGGTGCMFNKKPSINQEALAYMAEKYGEKFIYSAPYGDSMSGTREFLATCESLPGKQVLVKVENFREKDKTYRDNYIAVKYEEETKQLFSDLVLQHIPDVTETNVYYNASKVDIPEQLAVDATHEEYLYDDNTFLNILIEIKASEYPVKQRIYEFAEVASKKCIGASITIIFVDEEIYGTLDRLGLNRLIPQKECFACVGIHVDSGKYDVTW